MLRGSVFARRAGGAFPKIFREMSAIKYRLDFNLAPMTIGKGWCVQVTAPPAPFQDRQCRSYLRPGVGTPSRGLAQAAPLKRRYSAGKQRRVNRSRSAMFPRSNLNGVWREVIGDRSDARCLCGASR
jgi:hypothetical protein